VVCPLQRSGNADDEPGLIAVSPDGSKVYVAGLSQGTGTDGDSVTIAYDTATGDMVWLDRYVQSTSSIVLSPDGSRLFITGTGPGAGGLNDFATKAFDAVTGTPLWSKLFHGPSQQTDFASDVAISPDGLTVFVAGSSAEVIGNINYDWVTLAYAASNGNPVWLRRYNGAGNSNDYPFALVVSPDGSKVFVAGQTYSGTTRKDDYATAAYAVATGKPLWLKVYDGPGHDLDQAISIDASPDSSKVFVTGTSHGGSHILDYATIAYDAGTGSSLWLRRYNGPGNVPDFAFVVVASPDGSKVFVTGYSGGGFTGDDYATLAYDATTGSTAWLARYDGPVHGADYAHGLAVSPDGTRVYVTGESPYSTISDSDYATIAYEA